MSSSDLGYVPAGTRFTYYAAWSNTGASDLIGQMSGDLLASDIKDALQTNLGIRINNVNKSGAGLFSVGNNISLDCTLTVDYPDLQSIQDNIDQQATAALNNVGSMLPAIGALTSSGISSVTYPGSTAKSTGITNPVTATKSTADCTLWDKITGNAGCSFGSILPNTSTIVIVMIILVIIMLFYFFPLQGVRAARTIGGGGR